MLNRRKFVAGLPAALLAAPHPARASEPLAFWGPPAAPSIILAQAVAGGLLKTIAPTASFKVWRTPDEMRAGISSGAMTAIIVPTYVAANLYNRGLGITRLCDMPTEWPEQHKALGLALSLRKVGKLSNTSLQPASLFPRKRNSEARDGGRTSPPMARLYTSTGKSRRSGECVVAHACSIEPVSVLRFGLLRKINRGFCQFCRWRRSKS